MRITTQKLLQKFDPQTQMDSTGRYNAKASREENQDELAKHGTLLLLSPMSLGMATASAVTKLLGIRPESWPNLQWREMGEGLSSPAVEAVHVVKNAVDCLVHGVYEISEE